jgi:hypothetical protein
MESATECGEAGQFGQEERKMERDRVRMVSSMARFGGEAKVGEGWRIGRVLCA